MTKVARLFEEEKIEYANNILNERTYSLVKEMLLDNEDMAKIMKYSKLTKKEVLKIQADLLPLAANH